MCLILLSFQQRTDYPLVFAANRDEFYDRASAPAAFWEEAPELLAGRDLVAGGTWFGVTKTGRLAAITNYREPGFHRFTAPSRGKVVSDFLLSEEEPEEYLRRLEADAHRCNGFSLILGYPGRLFYFSNRNDRFTELKPGLYGLSNHLLDSPWPKVERGKKALADVLFRGELPREKIMEGLFQVLADRKRPEDGELPDTGVGLEWERVLSSLFVTSPVYGTRSSTVLLVDREGTVTFEERVFDGGPNSWSSAKYEFRIEATGKGDRDRT